MSNEEQNNSEVSKEVRIYCVIFMSICLIFFLIDFIFITQMWDNNKANVLNSLFSTVISVLLVGLFDIIDYFKESSENSGKHQYENEKFKTLTKGIMMFIGSILPLVYGVFSLGKSIGFIVNIFFLIALIVGIVILNKK
ncbi:hypothetical protein K4Q10_06075 [Staphylococcus epidermidis]|nr:hypothetical protein [Staphylococcus epidermidis]